LRRFVAAPALQCLCQPAADAVRLRLAVAFQGFDAPARQRKFLRSKCGLPKQAAILIDTKRVISAPESAG
jgi:hypothetical protein